ncbi:hypothetical protein CBER1_00179 [Cercospora berteroae]|uniref:Uncharacterized protein n=1 Tax=Cercospora berteroae TaxID=357750 RepID=A0A2S6CDP1_9PEZI|nr:hypothetical protein CBER1_00179 [Cercospora berteroae]
MRNIIVLSVLTVLAGALPVPQLWLHSSSPSDKLQISKTAHRKRQLTWDHSTYYVSDPYYTYYGSDTPIGPSLNIYDFCLTEEGKKVFAQCSGGSRQETHTSYNGYLTDIETESLVAWHTGGDPLNKDGWNPFQPTTATSRVNSGGSINRTRTTVSPGTGTRTDVDIDRSGGSGTNTGRRTSTGGGGAVNVNGKDKNASGSSGNLGCLGLGIATLGTNC